MQLSPLDIRKQTFKRTLRGVDPEEVRMFLELVASEFEKVVQENAMMAEKLSYQEERLDEYRDLEKSLRNSLVTAERIASESREASDREAQRIIQDAHSRAERILEDSRERLQRLVHEAGALSNKKETYVRRFRAMLEGQLSVLSDHEDQFSEIDSIADDAHEALSRAGSRERSHALAPLAEPIRSTAGARRGAGTGDGRGSGAGAGAGAGAGPGAGPGPGAGAGAGAVPREMRGGSLLADHEAAEHREAREREELPFDEKGSYRSVSASDVAGGDPDGFFEVRERREGFFQVDASEEFEEYEPRRTE